ncbi:glycosyltransferase [Trueperella abortisuis]|uniref:glycosyltransferase n=1 Tax=Trueperella abortisuis TaxID=445930 RepID=UPI00289358C1|nr:glycosyltransferase [Trueperella abortisuis]
MKELMVYHAPYPMDWNASSASRVRPARMLQAFRENYDVHEIVGNPNERRRAFSELKKRVRAGEKVAFAYSESSTSPNCLATSVKKGVDPLIEPRIFAYFKRHGIPFGQFYRDVYWMFPDQLTTVAPLRKFIMRILYRFDLALMDKTGAHLFVPTAKMGTLLPAFSGRCTPLPPGTTPVDSAYPDQLSLFYVGGIGPHYRMEELFKAVKRVPEVRLTACFPKAGWDSVKADYRQYMGDNIRIVHASNKEMPAFYDETSAALLFVEPSEYREFAAPMKSYEALSFGKPVITTKHTHAGRECERLGVGVALDYDAEALEALLRSWLAHPDQLAALQARAREVRNTERWLDRTSEVARVLR